MKLAPVQPLRFEPILKPKVWGGRRLERYGKSLPPGTRVGESWEIADLASTSPSGGGGQAARSVVADGPLRGRTLEEVLAAWDRELLGDAARAPGGGFPLLVKLLDAREHLSVQVHPSPAYAAAHPEAHLKNECWYVLEAGPGARIFQGVRDGVTREAFARAVREGGVSDLLESVPAVPGQCHEVPSGTVHALGAGVLVAEVQTPSDTTFRVYDWAVEYDRKPRELHVEAALECIAFTAAPPATRLAPGDREGSLARTRSFEMREIRLERRESTVPVPARAGGCVVLVVVDGEVEVRCSRGHWRASRLSRGETLLVPAVSARTCELHAVTDFACVLTAEPLPAG